MVLSHIFRKKVWVPQLSVTCKQILTKLCYCHCCFVVLIGVNLYAVAAHEFGHTLGLAHSDEKKALMHFLHKGYTGNVIKLHQDDIEGLQKMYGK